MPQRYSEASTSHHYDHLLKDTNKYIDIRCLLLQH